MKKYLMTIQFAIEAEGRMKAWDITRQIADKHLRSLVDIVSAHELSVKEAQDTIAVNEPIKGQG